MVGGHHATLLTHRLPRASGGLRRWAWASLRAILAAVLEGRRSRPFPRLDNCGAIPWGGEARASTSMPSPSPSQPDRGRPARLLYRLDAPHRALRTTVDAPSAVPSARFGRSWMAGIPAGAGARRPGIGDIPEHYVSWSTTSRSSTSRGCATMADMIKTADLGKEYFATAGLIRSCATAPHGAVARGRTPGCSSASRQSRRRARRIQQAPAVGTDHSALAVAAKSASRSWRTSS